MSKITVAEPAAVLPRAAGIIGDDPSCRNSGGANAPPVGKITGKDGKQYTTNHAQQRARDLLHALSWRGAVAATTMRYSADECRVG